MRTVLGVIGAAAAGCATTPSYPLGPEGEPPRAYGANKKEILEEHAKSKRQLTRLKEAQFEAMMKREDVALIAAKYDERLSLREAFREEIIRRAQNAWNKRKEEVTPEQAFLEVMATDRIALEIATSLGKSYRLKAGMNAKEVSAIFGNPKEIRAIRGVVKDTKSGAKTLSTFIQWVFDTRPCKLRSGSKAYEHCKLTFDEDLILFEQQGIDPAYIDISTKWQTSEPIPE